MLRQTGLPATHTLLRLDPLILNPNRPNLLTRRSRLDTMAPIIPTEHDAAFINRLLDAIEHDVVPKTSDGVREGNKLFGAAVLRKSDLSLVAADTNKEMEWPLLHGEVSCLRTLNSMPEKTRPAAKDCVFIATHEPCSLCLSAITWSGFDNFYYLFSYVDTKDAFNIPHDLNILKEVFGCDHGCYRRENEYWTAHDINKLAAALPAPEAKEAAVRIERLKAKYDGLSQVYQDSKADNAIPLN
mmetsp:Transcript_24666/g.62124  ORF Transcript_24666/g.62124 Transcript_24666/m.62124 type:complete len:242 (-) Transcript_24666:380-1105(-)